VPVALGGVVWFGLVALIAGFAKPGGKNSAVGGYLFALSVAGLAVVLSLGYISMVIAQQWCVLCLATYACVIVIFGLAAAGRPSGLASLPARVGPDLNTALARPAVLAVSALYVAAIIGALAFFPREGDAAAAASAAATTAANAPGPAADVRAAFTDAWAKQPRVNLGVPADGAKVVIVKFNDYECPTCGQAEMLYKPVLDKLRAANPGAIKYVMKDGPWNSSCNFTVPQTFIGHEASCAAAAAARMAADKGKLEEMRTWLFANQETTPANVTKAASQILGVNDFDAEYPTKLAGIKQDIADGAALQVRATPTFFINGVRLPEERLMDPPLFELAIQIELDNAARPKP
jgi:protein-disulfide isomerase